MIRQWLNSFARRDFGPPTRFASASRMTAWCTLAASLGLTIWGVVAARNVSNWQIGHQGSADLEFYRDVVDKIRAGQGYYDILAQFFSSGNHSAASVFH